MDPWPLQMAGSYYTRENGWFRPRRQSDGKICRDPIPDDEIRAAGLPEHPRLAAGTDTLVLHPQPLKDLVPRREPDQSNDVALPTAAQLQAFVEHWQAHVLPAIQQSMAALIESVKRAAETMLPLARVFGYPQPAREPKRLDARYHQRQKNRRRRRR